MSIEQEKRLAGEAAAELVESGMIVGLGTGSTAAFAVRRLGERVQQGLRIRGVPTSRQTAELAGSVGIEIMEIGQVAHIDLTIDGADEIDPALNLIKGGGGALFREKIVAAASARLVIFADHTKLVPHLGAFPLPVEVNPFGWQLAAARIRDLGAAEVALRGGEASPFVTDNHGHVLDCHFKRIADPVLLADQLKRITGVMETGLFIGMAELAVLGDGGSVRHIQRPPA